MVTCLPFSRHRTTLAPQHVEKPPVSPNSSCSVSLCPTQRCGEPETQEAGHLRHFRCRHWKHRVFGSPPTLHIAGRLHLFQAHLLLEMMRQLELHHLWVEQLVSRVEFVCLIQQPCTVEVRNNEPCSAGRGHSLSTRAHCPCDPQCRLTWRLRPWASPQSTCARNPFVQSPLSFVKRRRLTMVLKATIMNCLCRDLHKPLGFFDSYHHSLLCKLCAKFLVHFGKVAVDLRKISRTESPTCPKPVPPSGSDLKLCHYLIFDF